MKTRFLILSVLFGLIFGCANVMATYSIDGDLSDWGVIPFTSWTPSSTTADFVVEDFPISDPVWPLGGEVFDMEALYFDDYYSTSIGGWAYFALVLSMPPGGAYIGSTLYTVGDLALDIDNDPSTGEYGYEYGIKIEGPDKGMVCYKPNWHKTTVVAKSPGLFTCDGSDSVVIGGAGTAQIAYVNANRKDYPIDCTFGGECKDNYVIEIGVRKGYLGLPEEKHTSNMHITQTCGNDEIELEFDWDFPAPELISAVLAIALISPAFIYLLVKRKKR